MSDTPWMKFYPRDWRGDQALRAVSIAARGLWMECLCIMHEARPYGHLLLNGQPIETDVLARMTGVPADEVSALMAELRQAGVLSVTGKGVVFSRRMTKDQARAQKGRKAVAKRWRQEPDNTGLLGEPNRYPTRGPITQKPEARSQKPDISDSSLRSESDARDAKPPLDAEFADWYAGYPHKVGKAAALKAFRSARRKADMPVLQAGVARYIREKPPDRPWCNPATWLNQERWNDQPAVEASGGGHGAGRSGRVGPATAAINAILGTRYGETREPEFLDAEFRVVPRQH